MYIRTQQLPETKVIGWGVSPSDTDPSGQVGYVTIMVGQQGPIRITMPLERYERSFLPQVEQA